MKTKEIQVKYYFLTINNPLNHGMTHANIKDILILNFRTFVYLAMMDEIGENGTYHTHILICFSSRVRISMIKKYFPSAHIDVVKGSISDVIKYIKKEGKWTNSKKAETTVEGTFEEHGTRPADAGRRDDMSELYQMVLSGMTNAEIIDTNQDYILQIDKLDKLRTTILTEKYKDTVRLDLEVIYLSGPTGVGKTRGVYESNGYSNVYRVTDYRNPFDGYNCQSIICFDEFRDSIPLKLMLLYCDIYPIELPSRYTNKFACYNKIYIISNWPLESQFKSIQDNDRESWNAFIRRINKVVIYDTEGNRTVHNSAKEYLYNTNTAQISSLPTSINTNNTKRK
ncbi:RNA helicase [Butyrivibrio proteoclasticus]|uniref:ATP-dependent helicase Rep n=1 Tax=Butyrivibrio proteoclasticus TaxID=43305 RepID=A0A1I5XXP0_9FIRM|nr:hypothetical protein [Butyrivibrio proteoclasticus]SFQ36487.1 RNA helicase [Butyrivibrio proteoclasticus]